MYNFDSVYSTAWFIIITGIVIAILMPLYAIKDKKNRMSLIIFGVIGSIICISIGINDLNEIKNPEIEIYIGEYIDYDVSGQNSVGEYVFDNHDENDLKAVFRSEIFRSVFGEIPEKGKWYEIHYLPDTTYRTPVKIEEVSPPDYYKESSETE